MLMSYLLTHICVFYLLILKFDTLYHFCYYLVELLFFHTTTCLFFYNFCLFCTEDDLIFFRCSFNLCHIFGLCHLFCLFHGFLLDFLTFKRLQRFFYHNFHKFLFMNVLLIDVS